MVHLERVNGRNVWDILKLKVADREELIAVRRITVEDEHAVPNHSK